MNREIISGIQELVKKIKEEKGIVNEIIRDDVFSILQACDCVVLYYPLDGENPDGCAGCHIEKWVNGHKEQFVFINTNNTRERQAFSAAHELGHIWKVDERLRQMFPQAEIETEEVINRFAAELLMPQKHFEDVLKKYMEKIGYKGPFIQENTLVEVIAYLMNYFFVPYKSVVLRFNELGKLDSKYNGQILPYKDGKLLNEIIRSEQYTRLGLVNKLKSMDNLQEYLVEAERRGVINDTRLSNIRSRFDIEEIGNVPEDNVKLEFQER